MKQSIFRYLALFSGAVAAALPALAQPDARAELHGVIRNAKGVPVPAVTILARNLDAQIGRTARSGLDGSFRVPDLQPGRYSVTAEKEGEGTGEARVELAREQSLSVDITLNGGLPSKPALQPQRGFVRRFFQAYADDWKASASASGPAPPFRGFPAPVTSPPFPFTVWPYGGSPVIGQPWTQAGPLMTAIWGGGNGEEWKRSGVQIYGWLNGGFDVSSSRGPGYSTYPEAYPERGNTVQMDQEVLYIERQPDTVQTDHVDWGFRIAALYGLDYRFTTAKGYFSQQLLEKNRENGFDLPMAYFDLYIPQVAEGMNIRVGRYISLPDIEAQLAPNNYTYSHSLTYTFDCYTQTGINVTTKLSNHWLFQIGLSPGCDVAPWIRPDAKATLNSCIGYTWRNGLDNIYTCANSVNSGHYAYNNMQAYYSTWYHKFSEDSHWHTATETWYQYERDTPNVNNPAAQSLIETNANGAVCNRPDELTCYAPSYAIVNYLEREFSRHDYLSIRNEFFDDFKGQRTGFKTSYTTHTIGWGHWIGSTVLFRPELRYDRAYNAAPYNNGTRRDQLTFASDVIVFF
ncbi:MAG TPA: TonB-dependent receptor [Bryobacteraceae bacterium]|nr:TonB-dependent receptor [Bryobacteraceae bacterium]